MADNNLIGSVGTLQAAALETIGHHLQSELLDALLSGWGIHIGALLFAISAVAGILTIAIGGNYKWGLYFLLGVPIAFWFLDQRAPSTGAQWRFGNRVFEGNELVTRTKVQAGLLGGDQGDQQTARVIGVFKAWNHISSGMVQGLISVVRLQRGGNDVDVITKVQRFLLINRMEAADPRLNQFFSLAPMGHCADYFFTAARAQGDGTTPQGVDDAARARARMEELGRAKAFNFSNYPALSHWVVQENFASQFQTAFGVAPAAGLNQNFTCVQLWKFAVEIYKEHAESLVTFAMTSGLPTGAVPADFVNKMVSKFNLPTAVRDRTVPVRRAITNPEQSFAIMLNFVTARLLLRELVNLNPNVVRASMIPNVPSPLGQPSEQDDPLADAMDSWYRMNNLETFFGLNTYLNFSLTMPYLQGMGLMFLAWACPIFVLAAFVPGRHHGGLLWFNLWLWLKLWDFGFAVVMLLDKMLFALMPVGPPVTDEMLANPGLAFRAVLQSDPGYSGPTYYVLIATCILAVPVLSGLLVRKGGSEIVQGVAQLGSSYAQDFGKAMTAFQGSMLAAKSAEQASKNTYEAVSNHLLSELTNNVVLRNYATSVGMAAASNAGLKLSGDWKAKFAALGSVTGEPKSKAFKAAQDYFKSAAGEQLQANLELIAFRESNSDRNYRLASQAVGYGYFSHDFAVNYPTNELDVARNAANISWGGSASSLVHNVRSQIITTATDVAVPKPR